MQTKKYVPYLFILPAMLGVLLFNITPIFQSIKDSLYTMSFLQNEKVFVGLDNYISLFQAASFWHSLKVTLLMNIVLTPLQVTLALLLAILLSKEIKGLGFFRAVHLIPIAVAQPISAVIWMMMLNQDQGIVNSILVSLGLNAQPFLASSDQALWTIVGIAIWKGTGYWSLFLLAGLQGIPRMLYEAGSIDGAGAWRKFINITLPMMKRPLTFVLVAGTVINFLIFAPMYIMTGGGPQNSTNVLMLESFNYAFRYSDIGAASAIVVLLFVLLLCIVLVQFKLLKPRH